MITIITTRFTNESLQERIAYIQKHRLNGCIYGSPQEITYRILPESMLFVIEMNNSTNQIMGIGLIRNRPVFDKYYKIYENGNYNRYIYKSEYHLDRDVLKRHNPNLVDVLDYILFKEKTHLKRGTGFVTVPLKLLNHSRCDQMNLKNEIRDAFINVFGEKTTVAIQINTL